MLKLFRKHTKVIIWIVVVSFVIWGGYSVTTLKKEGRYAGEVFGKSVTFQEYNKFYNATQLFMPSKDKTELENPEVIRTLTWQNIIYAREAKRMGIQVTDEEVRQEVSNILTQQGISAPTEDQYRIWLTRTLRISPRDFEEGLREFMRIQKLLRRQLETFDRISVNAPAAKAKTNDDIKREKQQAFIQWTNELNKKADLKDYLALPPAAEMNEEMSVPEAPVEEVAVSEEIITEKAPVSTSEDTAQKNS